MIQVIESFELWTSYLEASLISEYLLTCQHKDSKARVMVTFLPHWLLRVTTPTLFVWLQKTERCIAKRADAKVLVAQT